GEIPLTDRGAVIPVVAAAHRGFRGAPLPHGREPSWLFRFLAGGRSREFRETAPAWCDTRLLLQPRMNIPVATFTKCDLIARRVTATVLHLDDVMLGELAHAVAGMPARVTAGGEQLDVRTVLLPLFELLPDLFGVPAVLTLDRDLGI